MHLLGWVTVPSEDDLFVNQPISEVNFVSQKSLKLHKKIK